MTRHTTAHKPNAPSMQEEARRGIVTTWCYNLSLRHTPHGCNSPSRTSLTRGDLCWPQIPRMSGLLAQGWTPAWLAPTTSRSRGRSKASWTATLKRPSARSHESLRRLSQSGYRLLGRHLRCSQVVVTGGAKCLTVTELKGRTPFCEGVLYPLALELDHVDSQ